MFLKRHFRVKNSTDLWLLVVISVCFLIMAEVIESLSACAYQV